MNWYLKVIKQYADFSGRARRKEYWMFALFNFIFALLAMVLDNVIGITFDNIPNIPYGYIYMLYFLALLIPGLAVAVRRLHDIGKSGWWLLISLIPIIGGIWLFVLFVTDSEAESNKWGANPKSI